MTSNKYLKELARQVLLAAELETYLVLEVLPGNKRDAAADQIHDRLSTSMVKAVDRGINGGKSHVVRTRVDLRAVILAEINKISLDLLISAKLGFEALQSSSVEFWINTTNRGNPPEFSRFAFSEFPFVNFHGEALAAALRIRDQQANLQLAALRFAHSRSEIRLFEMSLGQANAYGHKLNREVIQQHHEVQNLHDKLGKRLPQQMHVDLSDFYACIEVGSIYPYAIPIEIPMSAISDDLRFISQAFAGIGTTFSISFELHIEGSKAAVKKAHAARLMYEAAGVGFQVLSAWIMAVDTVNDHPRCSICYRHCSAISRCSVHATKKQETREARLGQRVRPHYEKRLLELLHAPAIKARLRTDLSWSDDADDATQAAVDRLGLSSQSCTRALVLANQLRDLLVVMSNEIKGAAAELFHSILTVAFSIETQPAPVGDEAGRLRERQHHSLKELLSLKGFFKAWCGKGRYSPEINLPMLGFDRDHPVTKGSALVSTMVPRALLENRAWTEAMIEFKHSNLATANDIKRLLHLKQSNQQVAEQLGIGLSTVYKILSRGRKNRKRQYLGRK